MAAIVDTAQTEKQLVVFDLASEGYGVDIGAVREIIRMQEITRVPRSPEFVEGVINLRGKVIPVIDLRKRFGLVVAEQTKDNRIVVVDIGKQDLGVIVDAVSDLAAAGQTCQMGSIVFADHIGTKITNLNTTQRRAVFISQLGFLHMRVGLVERPRGEDMGWLLNRLG